MINPAFPSGDEPAHDIAAMLRDARAAGHRAGIAACAAYHRGIATIADSLAFKAVTADERRGFERHAQWHREAARDIEMWVE